MLSFILFVPAYIYNYLVVFVAYDLISDPIGVKEIRRGQQDKREEPENLTEYENVYKNRLVMVIWGIVRVKLMVPMCFLVLLLYF